MKLDWEPLVLEAEASGFHILIARAVNPKRWRYSVTPIEFKQRPRSAFDAARGYASSRERAQKAAMSALATILRRPR